MRDLYERRSLRMPSIYPVSALFICCCGCLLLERTFVTVRRDLSQWPNVRTYEEPLVGDVCITRHFLIQNDHDRNFKSLYVLIDETKMSRRDIAGIASKMWNMNWGRGTNLSTWLCSAFLSSINPQHVVRLPNFRGTRKRGKYQPRQHEAESGSGKGWREAL